MSNRKDSTMSKSILQSAVPPTPAEVAVAAAAWERRGILARLVRLDDAGVRAEEPQTTTGASSPVAAPAAQAAA
jgi:hypothetical protein